LWNIKYLAEATVFSSPCQQELLHRTQQQLPDLNTLLLLWQRLVKEDWSTKLGDQAASPISGWFSEEPFPQSALYKSQFPNLK